MQLTSCIVSKTSILKEWGVWNSCSIFSISFFRLNLYISLKSYLHYWILLQVCRLLKLNFSWDKKKRSFWEIWMLYLNIFNEWWNSENRFLHNGVIAVWFETLQLDNTLVLKRLFWRDFSQKAAGDRTDPSDEPQLWPRISAEGRG